jgi:hypothetical protein
MPVLFAAAVRMIVAPCRANLHSSALARTQVSTEAGGDGAALNVRCIHLWTTIFAIESFNEAVRLCLSKRLIDLHGEQALFDTICREYRLFQATI